MRIATQQDLAQKNLKIAGVVNITAGDLAKRHGFTVDTYNSDGLGKVFSQTAITDDNLVFSIEQLPDAPGHYAQQTKILCEGDTSQALQNNLVRVLKALGVTPNDVDWVQDGLSRRDIRQKVALAVKPLSTAPSIL